MSIRTLILVALACGATGAETATAAPITVASYVNITAPAPQYEDTGNVELNDDIIAGFGHLDPGWVGYQSALDGGMPNQAVMLFHFSGLTTVGRLDLTYDVSHSVAIDAPGALRVTYSTDGGSTFGGLQSFGSSSFDNGADGVKLATLALSGTLANAVRLELDGWMLPSPTPEPFDGQWLFLTEVDFDTEAPVLYEVPEPTSLLLMGAGFAGAAARLRRRR